MPAARLPGVRILGESGRAQTDPAMRDSSKTSSRDRGVAQVLLMRLEAERLPYALKLKAKVDRGEPLSDFDARFLKRVLQESGEARRLAEKLPQYQQVVTQMTQLYDEITRKGLENERKSRPGGTPS
jgi:hypothetical protein